MDYNHITKFLEKFKKLIFQKEELKNVAVLTISKEIKHNIESDDVSIKNGIIYIKGSPMLRSEIMMHKKQILDNIKNLLPDCNFSDIK